jgi:serine/threonine protein kinase
VLNVAALVCVKPSMNEISLHAPISKASLADSIAASGLVSDDELAAVLATANGDQQELGKLLSSTGLLTQFQISALSEDRAGSLRIGNYDIIDRLGAGGMGTVFKARHRRMKRVVALKVLAANLSKNPIFVKRFQREVETIASLGHPNVVMAYDADEADVGHFLVMEFVNGRDLAACVEREGPFPVAHAVNCILQAARGLSYAHEQGIIHRDIKPHNLLRDENNSVKVTDLGLARLNHGDEGPATGAEVTMAGGVIGTADYMPPEQAVDSTTIDHRADIYSLGCTLYYLLQSMPPYSGNTIMSILLKHREAEIPQLGEDRDDVPPELENLFRRMLAKKPDERVQKMVDVVEELEAIARSLAPDEPGHGHANMTVELPSGLESLGSSGSTIALGKVPDQTLAIETVAKPITVLVVEPSRVQAAIIKGYLQEQSLPIVGAVANGNDAIQTVRSLRPRAVVSAMHLSDISGVELARQIRAEIKVDAPGFVLVTSEADEGESVSLSQLNRVLTLRKPFTAGQMAEALQVVTGASLPLKSRGKIPRSQLRVLIVDDSTTARIQVRTVLQGLGFSLFTEVPDGAYAIAVAARESCDLIVTDYNMPLMDGRALVSYLKQNPATAVIPIVMVTTETEPRVLDPVRKLGVVAVVEKAFPASVVGPLLDSLFGSP